MAGIMKDGKPYSSLPSDGYVAKTDIVDSLTSEDNTKPLSAKQGKELEDKKIDKTSISKSISASSTDEQVPSAKAIYSKFRTLEMRDYFANFGDTASLSKLGIGEISTLTSLLDISKRLVANTRLIMQSNNADYQLLYDNGVTPVPRAGLLVITIQSLRASAIYTTDCGEVFTSSTSNSYNTEWTPWSRVCTTKVEDVDWTVLPNASFLSSGNIMYCVKNGICFVSVRDLSSSTLSTISQIITTGLPIPKAADNWHALCANNDSISAPIQTFLVSVTGDGSLFSYRGTDNAHYYGTFSYPVAES